MVVLHEGSFQSGSFFKQPRIKAIIEKSAIIAEHFWLNNQYFGKSAVNDIQTHLIASEMICCRYLP